MACRAGSSRPQWYRTDGTQSARVDLAPPWAEDLHAYVSEELKVRARDGVMIPLSVLHSRQLRLDGKAPLWLAPVTAPMESLLRPHWQPADWRCWRMAEPTRCATCAAAASSARNGTKRE